MGQLKIGPSGSKAEVTRRTYNLLRGSSSMKVELLKKIVEQLEAIFRKGRNVIYV
jgi:hypothetical protein